MITATMYIIICAKTRYKLLIVISGLNCKFWDFCDMKTVYLTSVLFSNYGLL